MTISSLVKKQQITNANVEKREETKVRVKIPITAEVLTIITRKVSWANCSPL